MKTTFLKMAIAITLLSSCAKEETHTPWQPITSPQMRGDNNLTITHVSDEESDIVSSYIGGNIPASIDDATTINYSDMTHIKIVTARSTQSSNDFYAFVIHDGSVKHAIAMKYSPSDRYNSVSPVLFENHDVPYDGILLYSDAVSGDMIAEYEFDNGSPVERKNGGQFGSMSDCLEYYGNHWLVWGLGVLSPCGAFGGVVVGCAVAVGLNG